MNAVPGDSEVVTVPAAPTRRGGDASCDLFHLLEAYERSVILAALGAVGGRQRSAAALLRIPPSTLHQKMKRLGIGRHRVQPAEPAGEQVGASFRWTGTLPPGGTIEIRGLNGPVRIEAGGADRVEVEANRRGSRSLLSAIEVKVVEHGGGVTVCAVCQGEGPAPSHHVDRRLLQGLANARVDIRARVPPDARVVASTVNDDIEVVGVANVEAGTANGRVRLLTLMPPRAETA